MKKKSVLISTIALSIPLGLVLTGCSVVDEVTQKNTVSDYPDAAALASDWNGTAPWAPDDARDVRVSQSTVADDAVILLDSELDLDPSLCSPVDRQSAPAYVIDGAPDAYSLDTVFACGSWTVGETESGWLGWTPGHPDEAEQSASQ